LRSSWQDASPRSSIVMLPVLVPTRCDVRFCRRWRLRRWRWRWSRAQICSAMANLERREGCLTTVQLNDLISKCVENSRVTVMPLLIISPYIPDPLPSSLSTTRWSSFFLGRRFYSILQLASTLPTLIHPSNRSVSATSVSSLGRPHELREHKFAREEMV
jgi:hypothetical protein